MTRATVRKCAESLILIGQIGFPELLLVISGWHYASPYYAPDDFSTK